MGLSLMLESVVLKQWLEEEVGLGPVGVTGASMGGHVRGMCVWDGRLKMTQLLYVLFVGVLIQF